MYRAEARGRRNWAVQRRKSELQNAGDNKMDLGKFHRQIAGARCSAKNKIDATEAYNTLRRRRETVDCCRGQKKECEKVSKEGAVVSKKVSEEMF